MAEGAITAAGDQFSLAALAYEWMTGRRAPSAFVAGDMAPVPGADREALAAIFARALHPDPDRRFSSCGEFVTALAEVAALMADDPEVPATEARPRKRGRTPAVASLPLESTSNGAPLVVPIDAGATDPPLESFPAEAGETASVLGDWSDAPVAADRMVAAAPYSTIDEPPAPARVDVAPPAAARLPMTPAPPISTMREPVPFRTDDRSGPLLGSAVQPTPSGFGVPSLIAGIVLGVAIGVGVATFLWGRTAPSAPVANTASTSAPVAAAPPTATEQPASPPVKADPPQATPVTPDRGTAPAPAPPAPASAPRQAAPTPAPAPAPATAVGNLLVRTSPDGATVFIDGDRRGVTPLTVQKLPLGTRRVRVQRDGFTTEERQVALTRSRPSRSLDLRLTRTEPAATTAGAATTAKTGTLVVESRPTGATVLLNGRPAGTHAGHDWGPGARVIHRAIAVGRFPAHLDHRTRGRGRACARGRLADERTGAVMIAVLALEDGTWLPGRVGRGPRRNHG